MLINIVAWALVITIFVGLFVALPLSVIGKMVQRKRQTRVVTPTLICPTCHVMAVERVPVGGKVGSAVLIGAFAIPKIGKTFRCRNCGYAW